MDSMLDFDTKGPGFDSRSLHILFTSVFLLCQVLSETNFPCISTSNFPCECTKKLHQLFQKTLTRPLRPAFGRPPRQARRVGKKVLKRDTNLISSNRHIFFPKPSVSRLQIGRYSIQILFQYHFCHVLLLVDQKGHVNSWSGDNLSDTPSQN